MWRKKKKLDDKYIEKVRNYDRTRKRENKKISSPIYSSPKGPSYYSILGWSKEIWSILGDSPKTLATILTHVVRHVMKSPRKSKYITVDTKPMNYHPTTPKEDSVTKQLRKIAVLRSHRKHHKSEKIAESLRSRFKTIMDIADICGDDPKSVYCLLLTPRQRIQDAYTRKLRDEIRDEVEIIYSDEQVSYCLPDMKYVGYRFMSCTIHEAYFLFYVTVEQKEKLQKKHSSNWSQNLLKQYKRHHYKVADVRSAKILEDRGKV